MTINTLLLLLLLLLYYYEETTGLPSSSAPHSPHPGVPSQQVKGSERDEKHKQGVWRGRRMRERSIKAIVCYLVNYLSVN